MRGDGEEGREKSGPLGRVTFRSLSLVLEDLPTFRWHFGDDAGTFSPEVFTTKWFSIYTFFIVIIRVKRQVCIFYAVH